MWAHPSLDDSERVALGMGYFVGLRRFEVMNLPASHVDTEAGRLVAFKRKGGLYDDMAYGSAVALIAQRLAYVIP